MVFADASDSMGTLPGMHQNQGRRTHMITLYHCHGARSFRPLWMLEEIGPCL